MSDKVSEKASRQVIEYAVVSLKHPVTGKPKDVPRIVGQNTVSLDLLIKRLLSGTAASRDGILIKTHFEMVMGEARRALLAGEAVNLGGYLRLQPYLKGNVGSNGQLTSKNSLAVRVTPLNRIKLALSAFAWRLRGDRAKVID